MTTHLKQYIDLSDIVAVKFECECGAYLSLPLFTQVHPPARCPICQRQWLDLNSKLRPGDRITQFFDAYHLLTIALDKSGPVPPGMDLKLELKETIQADPQRG